MAKTRKKRRKSRKSDYPGMDMDYSMSMNGGRGSRRSSGSEVDKVMNSFLDKDTVKHYRSGKIGL